MLRVFKAPDRDVLVIAVEHLRGGRGTEVFDTTDLEADLRRYSWRWSIEVTFHDTKQHLGIDEPQNRTRPAARRTAPTALVLYSLIVWWHEQVRERPAPALRNWRGKQQPSFSDMLGALRAESLQKHGSKRFLHLDSFPPCQETLRPPHTSHRTCDVKVRKSN